MNWHTVSRALIILAVSVLGVSTAKAQITGATANTDARTGRIYSYSFAPVSKATRPSTQGVLASVDLIATSDSFVDDNKVALGITNPATELVKLPLDSDLLGSRQKYLQQFMYKGAPIPVYSGELGVHMDANGQIKYVKTKIADSLPVGVAAKVSLATAKASALKMAQKEAGKISIKVSKAELVVLPLGIVLNTPASDTRLAYEVEVLDNQPKKRDQEGDRFSNTYFIDAVSGQKLFQVSGHREISRQVYDCAGGANANLCQLDMPDPNYTTFVHGASEGLAPRGPFPNPNFPLFYGSTDVDVLSDLLLPIHNYYSTTFGINGANGFGGLADWPSVPQTITRGVANDDGYAGYACAGGASFSTNTGSIFFCRGMVVPDSVAHEYTHGIVHHSFHDGSGYPIGDVYSGQTASLDEGYADFMGQVFELNYTGSTDWINGTESGYNLRNLADPHSTLRSDYDNQPHPDRFYDTTFYCGSGDSGGAHRNMTIPAHAFYLMAQGGEHNGCDIAGQGIDVAQKILLRGWRNYFSRSVSFNEAYTDLIQACSDLYSPTVCAEVTKALQSVEMDQGGKCSAVAEAPPACATKHAGTQNTTYKQNGVTTLYAPNEQIWLSGAGGAPFKSVNVFVQPHAASIATWSAISGAPTASMVVNWDATSRTLVTTTSTVGLYDVVIDGNQDGFYQPWADQVIPIEVKVPASGDGACYRGDSYVTSENCYDQANDCACSAAHGYGYGYACIDGMYSRLEPRYMCFQIYSQGPS